MTKFFIIFIIILFSFLLIAKSKDFSFKEPTIKSGLKESKKNIVTIFKYKSSDMYKIFCKVGYITTIQLQPGEAISYLGAGDVKRWTIDQESNGTKDGENLTIVMVKPFSENIKTNLIINTIERSYQFFLISSKSTYVQFHNYM